MLHDCNITPDLAIVHNFLKIIQFDSLSLCRCLCVWHLKLYIKKKSYKLLRFSGLHLLSFKCTLLRQFGDQATPALLLWLSYDCTISQPKRRSLNCRCLSVHSGWLFPCLHLSFFTADTATMGHFRRFLMNWMIMQASENSLLRTWWPASVWNSLSISRIWNRSANQ